MFYPRGLSQQYLMVGSVQLFGMSEWALRFPSALFGVLLIPLAFLIGRRFLQPGWNIAFTAAIALLPEFVIYSQTARMYIFMLVALAVSVACVFQWEKDGRIVWLAIGVVSMIIGIELHALAAFSALVFLMPGIVRGDLRQIIYGCVASFCVLFGYFLIDTWVNSQYPVPPSDYASDLPPPTWRDGPSASSFELAQYAIVLLAGIVCVVGAIRLIASIKDRSWSIAIGILAIATVALQLLRYYHLAAFTIVATGVLAVRFERGRMNRALLTFIAFCGLLCILQASLLYVGGIQSFTKLVGALIGKPSVWPYARVAGYSEVAAVLCGALLIASIARFARGRSVPDYAVLAILTIGIPLFVMGLFLWDLPVRYTVGSALPLVLCGFAFAQSCSTWLLRKRSVQSARRWQAVSAIAVTLLVLNPVAVARAINPGYSLYPDHKGAAEFIRSQHITADDIVLAEDVLQQTYYLGSVDYWLISREVARRFVHRVDGRIQDFYTGSGVIGSGEELEKLLDAHPDRRIFVIGSGENQEDGRRFMRGFGIFEILASERFTPIFTGRDGTTKVWLAQAPIRPSTPKQAVTIADKQAETAH
jgi:Dolichyl-phosphate-mannose-protein mannosyltransferase